MIEEASSRDYDVCVIGAGPAGLTAAMELAARGLTVCVIESGTAAVNPAAQRLSDAEITTLGSHSIMDDAVRRGLGGTSAIWGGRCVPLDAIDFERREFIPESGWPLTDGDLRPFYQRACEILDVGTANFTVGACSGVPTGKRRLSSKFYDTDTLCATELERWSCEPNVWLLHKSKVETSARITLLSGLTCVGFRQSVLDGTVAEAIVLQTLAGQSAPARVKARVFVLACGGVESTRLVLNSIGDLLGLKLRSANLVGRFYMGHPSGKIADIELSGDPRETLYGFERDGGIYIRRRITLRPDILREKSLLNIAFWLDNAPISDWRHGSGVLSAAYLALTAPLISKFLAPSAIRKRVAGVHATQRIRHVWNCLRSPLKTASFCVRFCYQRYIAKPRVPGFFTFSSTNRYALHYHAEQAPNWDSTITLSEQVDAHGLRRARIALEWSEQDIESVVRAHEVLDAALQASGVGRLIYRYPPAAIRQAVHEQAVDGFHQLGTLRMSADSATGVTDPYGRLYGTSNCYVASSATFPTSGQANPTLALVALTVRQAQHIAACTENQGPLHA